MYLLCFGKVITLTTKRGIFQENGLKFLSFWIEDTLEQKFKLTVNREKTKTVNLAKPRSEINFLGYTFKRVKLRGREQVKFCRLTPSDKSIKKASERIRDLTDARNGYKPIPKVIKELNLFLKGWGQYFRLGHPSAAFSKVNRHVTYRLYKFLQRRSQRGYKKDVQEKTWYEYFKDMGLIVLTKEGFRMKAKATDCG